MIDPYANQSDVTAPVSNGNAVNLASDTIFDVVAPRGIYVGGAGTIIMSFMHDPDEFVTVAGAVGGTVLPFRPHTIRSAANGTTATNLIALY